MDQWPTKVWAGGSGMDTKRDTSDLDPDDRARLRAMIEAELAANPDTDSDLWDLLVEAA